MYSEPSQICTEDISEKSICSWEFFGRAIRSINVDFKGVFSKGQYVSLPIKNIDINFLWE